MDWAPDAEDGTEEGWSYTINDPMGIEPPPRIMFRARVRDCGCMEIIGHLFTHGHACTLPAQPFTTGAMTVGAATPDTRDERTRVGDEVNAAMALLTTPEHRALAYRVLNRTGVTLNSAQAVLRRKGWG